MTLANISQQMLLIGCGNMAGAMLSRWLDCGLDPAKVAVVRASGADVAPGVAVFTSVAEWRAAGRAADIVLLGVKPQKLSDVATDANSVGGALLCSLLAGVHLETLADQLPAMRAIVRVMPNTPVMLGRGVTALVADHRVTAEDRGVLDALADALGSGVWFDEEGPFDLVTAFTGSGPAFVYRLIDAYRAAGERLGLEPALADRLARATFDGAAAMVLASDESLGQLADRVASKGGMTQAGLDVLDTDGQTVKLIADTLRAARDRGRALAELARGE